MACAALLRSRVLEGQVFGVAASPSLRAHLLRVSLYTCCPHLLHLSSALLHGTRAITHTCTHPFTHTHTHIHTHVRPQLHFALLDQLGVPIEATQHVQDTLASSATVTLTAVGGGAVRGRRAGGDFRAEIVHGGWSWNLKEAGVAEGGLPVHAVRGLILSWPPVYQAFGGRGGWGGGA